MSNNIFEIPYPYYRGTRAKKVYNISMNDCKKRILEYDTKYNFLFNGNLILGPEGLQERDLEDVFQLLKENSNNFYALSAYLVYYDNKGKLDLEDKFQRLLKIDPGNPYVLLNYSRYLASPLYKLHGNNKHVEYAKYNCIKAIKILEGTYKKSLVPTFIYSWLGNIYFELGDAKKAIGLFEVTIRLNEKYHNHRQAEPFIWKARALKKIGKNQESQNILVGILHDLTINDKKDFRFYKILADNYYISGDYENFYRYLKMCIGKFLHDSLELNCKNNMDVFYKKIKVNSHTIFNNSLDSFFQYNQKYILDEMDKIIFFLAFLCKEQHLGKNIIFQDVRNIDKLCYNYLGLVYEGKITYIRTIFK